MMEIGPLSEWVGALAEFIAVAVALFLPYYNERKALHRRLHRYRHIVEQSLNAAANNQLTDDYRDFRAFIKITLQLDMDDTAVEILEVGQALIATIGDATELSPSQIESVHDLQRQLANIRA